MKKTLIFATLATLALGAMAQDNLFEGKSVYPLGEPKVWTYEDQTETFDVEALAKIMNTENKDNVFLYPEKGALSDDKTNQNVIGIQGFYVDMGESQEVASVRTTWEGAAADSYDIYVTDEVPTLDILETAPTYTVTGLG